MCWLDIVSTNHFNDKTEKHSAEEDDEEYVDDDVDDGVEYFELACDEEEWEVLMAGEKR